MSFEIRKILLLAFERGKCEGYRLEEEIGHDIATWLLVREGLDSKKRERKKMGMESCLGYLLLYNKPLIYYISWVRTSSSI